MNKQRLEAERLIYKVFDILDPSGENTDFWKEKFANMSDNKFKDYISNDFPFYFQTKAFKEPSIDQIAKALDAIEVPLLESIYMPYKYKDSNGRPMKTQPCLVVYLPIKRMKQLLTKKNGMSISTKTRDMRTGLLTGYDKNGMSSDREMEAMMVAGLDDTMKEFSTYKADSMDAKNAMYNTISAKGSVSFKDVPVDNDDSLSRNLINAYLLGSLIQTNIINEDYYLPITLKNKKREIGRE